MLFPRLNIVALLIAVAFLIEQNIFWGWNIMPTSERELITDGFNMILFALSWQSPRMRKIP